MYTRFIEIAHRTNATLIIIATWVATLALHPICSAS